MGKGLRVRVTNGQDGSTFERVLEDFPVRIGRDPLNELPLDFSFVSKFHAVVDLRGEVLLLRDLGSRNGTCLQLPTERIPPNDPIDLAASQSSFGIGTLRFEVSVEDVAPPSSTSMRRRRGGAVLSHVAEMPPAAPADPLDVRAGIEAWRGAWARLYTHLSNALGSMAADDRARFLHMLVTEHPALAQEPDFRRLAEHLGAPLDGLATAPAGTREEAVALLVLRDLAGWYVDADRPPQTVSQLVAFGRKLQDVLDALFVSFVPLREGLRKFEAEFDVKVGVETATRRGPAETAKNPAELAARLLDWNDPGDAGRVIRRVFADLMVHNVSLVNGVMRGGAALLAQLAPAALEEELEAGRARGNGGFAVGPWRYRALWDVLERRHDDLANEEQERFALLFGAEFGRAYTALAEETRLTKTPEIAAQQGKQKTTTPPPHVGPTGTVVVGEGAAARGPRHEGER